MSEHSSAPYGDDADREIDEVVARLTSALPRAGFGGRVIARLQHEPARGPIGHGVAEGTSHGMAWRRWTPLAAVAAVSCLALVVAYWSGTPREHPRNGDSVSSTAEGQAGPVAAPGRSRAAGDHQASSTSPGTAARGEDEQPGGSPRMSAGRAASRTTAGSGGGGWERPLRGGRVVEGPAPLEIAHLARPDPVSIEALDLESLALDELSVAPLIMDDNSADIGRR